MSDWVKVGSQSEGLLQQPIGAREAYTQRYLRKISVHCGCVLLYPNELVCRDYQMCGLLNIEMLPPTESEFNRLLASVCHIKEHASRPPPQCNSVEQKHLRLLDYIALLLVTKSRGDVAAVTMEPTATSLNFYFAKNRPCDL